MYISSSYAKIWGETNFQPWEITRSGSKAKNGERERKKERPKVGNNNGQLRISTPPRVAHVKLPGPTTTYLYGQETTLTNISTHGPVQVIVIVPGQSLAQNKLLLISFTCLGT